MTKFEDQMGLVCEISGFIITGYCIEPKFKNAVRFQTFQSEQAGLADRFKELYKVMDIGAMVNFYKAVCQEFMKVK